MHATDLLASGIADLTMDAFRLLATLVTGFAVLLGIAFFACGMALTVAEVVGWAREARRAPEPSSTLDRARTRG